MANCSENVFLVPCPRGNYLLHAPLQGVSALVNGAAAQEIRQGLEGGEVSESSAAARGLLARLRGPEHKQVHPEGRYAPEDLKLFVTNACNMRCRYCLACAGDYKPTYMTEEVCRLAFDFYVETLQRSGRREVKVSYLGGEPLMAEKLLVYADGYGRRLARERGFSFESELTTNGFMSERQARWVAKNLTHVVVSMDGHPEVHDRYRRDVRGCHTHSRIERTVRILEAEGARYGLRCTVDAESVGALPAMVEFMTQRYHPADLAIEPVLEEGRCSRQGIKSPDPAVFVRQVVRAAKIASQAGVQVFLRNANPELLVSWHCTVTREACVVTCDGFISKCCRAETRDTPGTEKFLIGRVDVQAGRVEIDEERVREMRGKHADPAPGCEFCFAKWHCGGGCRLLQRQPFCGQQNGYLCHVTREMTLWAILDKLGAPGDVIQERFSPEEYVSHGC